MVDPYEPYGDEETNHMAYSRTGAGASRLSLKALWEEGSARFDLPAGGEVTIGRAPDCPVRISHRSVSRQHAVLHIGATIHVEDLGSANGTRVAGTRLRSLERVPLPRGAMVQVGEVMLVLDDSRPTPVPRTGPSAPTSSAMQRVFDFVKLVAASNMSVILLGETGVGKTLLANRIHSLSPRAAKPMVALNCAALPEPLLESELFGYERGAFTSAATAKPGLVEIADGGTLFLDEIGELPAPLQAKLLHVLESGEVRRLGSVKPRVVNVRFVAATHRDLDALVASGAFRRDLYFRMNGMSVVVPPLRERAQEIAPLVAAMFEEICRREGRPPLALRADALKRLEAFDWPGNVRELRNVIERAALLCTDGLVGPEHLMLANMNSRVGSIAPPPAASTPRPVEVQRPPSLPRFDEDERRRILDALKRSGGNQKEAAKDLGVSRRTLLKRLDEYEVERPRKGRPGKVE